jgi:hypothetical protein
MRTAELAKSGGQLKNSDHSVGFQCYSKVFAGRIPDNAKLPRAGRISMKMGTPL